MPVNGSHEFASSVPTAARVASTAAAGGGMSVSRFSIRRISGSLPAAAATLSIENPGMPVSRSPTGCTLSGAGCHAPRAGVRRAIVGAITAAAVATGYRFEILALYYLPCRLAALFLGFAFDYLPHHGLHHKPSEDRLKTTRNRVGAERLLSPALLYQNYHLVHHLHPAVPFYRYLKVWRRNEEKYLAGDPALSTIGGRPLTVDEYRQLRELVEHHH